jgi:tetratricopeptide (TPR) repeat protein
MPISESDELFERGVKAVDMGNWLSALACFEKAVQLENRPVYNSYLAACIAKERGQYNKAVTLCREAIEAEPDNPAHHLNLGRIYLFQGLKNEAMKTFREGLPHDRDERIIRELDRLGTRGRPVIRFLKRNNPLNKYLGIILGKVGLR